VYVYIDYMNWKYSHSGTECVIALLHKYINIRLVYISVGFFL